MKRKLKLEQCIVESCKKTFSENDGNLETGICHVCSERKSKEAEKQRKILEEIGNRKKKVRKARKIAGKRLENTAVLYED